MSAKLTQLHYLVDKYDSKKAEKKITKKANKMGYELQSLNRGVAHFTKNGDNYISVKGTNIFNPTDLISDYRLGLGFSNSDLQFRQRRNEIKKIYKNSTGDNYLVGHSLGGSIITNAMTKSKSIRDNTTQAVSYNTGYTKLFHNELKKDLSKTDRKEIKEKLKHYSASGDIISNHLRTESIGDTIKIKTDKSNNLLQNHSLDNFNSLEEFG